MLILFRVIQGACGGALQPLSQAVLLEAFPPEERGKAMGFWGLGIVVAPILGPVLGGWLTDSYSWRWVFYINLPVGILSILMVQMFVFDPPYIKREQSRHRLLGHRDAGGLDRARCKSPSTRGRSWTGSARRFIVVLLAICGRVPDRVPRARIYGRPSGGEPARVQAAQLQRPACF